LVRDEKTGTVMMNEDLTFGAGQDKKALPQMRQHVDDLMAPQEATRATSDAPPVVSSSLSRDSIASIDKAENKIIPFVTDNDKARLESLIDRLKSGSPGEEESNRSALEREIRNHAYLL
jgi:hypothetical protein